MRAERCARGRLRVITQGENAPPLPSSNLLPDLSVGAAVHEPQQPLGPERMPSLSKRACGGALLETSSSRESECESERKSILGKEILPPDAPHVMVSPRPECQRRVSGLL